MPCWGTSTSLGRFSATLATQGILPGELTIHADRGSSMWSKPVALLLTDLGVLKTHSPPHVSNDNPYSEAQFRTLKYRPGPSAQQGISTTRAGRSRASRE
jgi:transposase InsO family protein